MRKFTILGGNSFGTLYLIDCIYNKINEFSNYHLVLFGRNETTLQQVAQYAQNKLPYWKVTFTTNEIEALLDAEIVLLQIRYRGLEGREEDERIALKNELPPDETLGPSGLHAAIKVTPYIKQLAQNFLKYCPQAWLINLANPLTIVTAILSKMGVQKCVGLCELPYITLLKTSDYLDVDIKDMTWDYEGLNHQGVLYNLKHKGKDILPSLIERLKKDNATIAGINYHTIDMFQAIPLKYYTLYQNKSILLPSRARYLKSLNAKIFSELQENNMDTPESLKKRYMEWYPLSVVPFLSAINKKEASIQIVNGWVDDMVIENKALVNHCGYKMCKSPSPPNDVMPWLKQQYVHASHMLDTVEEPCFANIEMTLKTDPLVPKEKVAQIASDIINSYWGIIND